MYKLYVKKTGCGTVNKTVGHTLKMRERIHNSETSCQK